jgi:hypothetical protein
MWIFDILDVINLNYGRILYDVDRQELYPFPGLTL